MANRHSNMKASKVALVLGGVALISHSSGMSFATTRPSCRVPVHDAVQASVNGRADLSGASTQPAGSVLAWAGAAAAVGSIAAAMSRRRSRTACEAVGLLYATQTGNTETVAGYIAEAAGLEAADVGDYGASDLADFDGLIVGCPTWNTGADEYRSGTAWDDLIDEIKDVDLKDKPVAIFGCGDSEAYGDNFCDGIEEIGRAHV